MGWLFDGSCLLAGLRWSLYTFDLPLSLLYLSIIAFASTSFCYSWTSFSKQWILLSIIRRSLHRVQIVSDLRIRDNSVLDGVAAAVRRADRSRYSQASITNSRGPLSYLRWEAHFCIWELLQVRISIALDRVTAEDSLLLVLSTIGLA